MHSCNSCAQVFESSAAQRDHMRSEWHRYNLKRRVAQLPAIPLETFELKVVQRSAESSEPQDVRAQKKALKARKQALLAEQRARDAARTEEELIQEKLNNAVEIPPTQCLFCTKPTSFSDVDTTLDHMARQHGFSLPEPKLLVDRMGLLKYLSEKIGLGNVCLVCPYQGRSLGAVQAHMLAKRHCRVPFDTEDDQLELSSFYEAWEDVDDDEDNGEPFEGDEELATDDQDGEQDNTLYHDGVDLHLPSGIKVGHRSLARYWRQTPRPERVLTEGQGTLAAAETRSFLPAYDTARQQVQQRAWHSEVQDLKKHDKRSAKFVNNQPHYRDQLLQ